MGKNDEQQLNPKDFITMLKYYSIKQVYVDESTRDLRSKTILFNIIIEAYNDFILDERRREIKTKYDNERDDTNVFINFCDFQCISLFLFYNTVVKEDCCNSVKAFGFYWSFVKVVEKKKNNEDSF